MTEIWKDIPGYDGQYQASSLGRFRTVIFKNKNGAQRLAVPRIKTQTTHALTGYLRVGLRSKMILSHRLILLTFSGPPREKQEAAHLNGIRTDNRAGNLKWTTKKENHSHKVAHGTAQRGSKNPFAKLTEAEVRTIREMSAKGCKGVDIAKLFMVNKNTVYQIIARKRWAHI